MSDVNSQITDAVTQTNVKVLGESPVEALAIAYQALAHSTGLAMENAMQTQGGMQNVANSTASAACTMILKTAG
ncbi:RebB family R body protein [Rhodovibrionaceae bacterium A322]